MVLHLVCFIKMVKAPEEEHPVKAFGWAARDTSGILSPFHFSRRYNYVQSSTIFLINSQSVVM